MLNEKVRASVMMIYISYQLGVKVSKKYGTSRGILWEVECGDAQSFKADMNILNLRDSLLVLSYRTSCYWEGLPDPSGVTPTWEFLLKPPIEIVRKINQL
jgi:hypothetical protein